MPAAQDGNKPSPLSGTTVFTNWLEQEALLAKKDSVETPEKQS
jgi:hypothetical protein